MTDRPQSAQDALYCYRNIFIAFAILLCINLALKAQGLHGVAYTGTFPNGIEQSGAIDSQSGAFSSTGIVASGYFVTSTGTTDSITRRIFFYGYDGGSTSQSLYIVDVQTGTVSASMPVLFPTGAAYADSMEFDNATGTLYGTAYDVNPQTLASEEKFGSINLQTGELSPISTLFEENRNFFTAASAIDTASHRFFVYGLPSPGTPQWYTIDIPTGKATVTAVATAIPQFIEYDSGSRILYGIANTYNGAEQFGSVDPQTGAFTPISTIATGGFSVGGWAALDSAGHRFFFYGCVASGCHLYTVNTQIGSVTTISPTVAVVPNFILVDGVDGLKVTTTSLPDASTGEAYSTMLAAAGGSGSGYTWSVVGGASNLPLGFTLSSDGILSSTGDSAAPIGPATFTVQVTDSASNTATQRLTLNVDPLEQTKQAGDQCGCSGSSLPSLSIGEPITITSGNVFEQVTDYQTEGANKLTFSRYYNSLGGKATLAVSLGNHWRSKYDRYLDIISPSAVFAERADGQGLYFPSSGGVWSSDSDVDLKLVQSGSTWTLTDKDDTIETYTVSAANPNEALLNAIQARNGYTQTLQYNANNQLISVTDSYGRSLNFTYNGNLLQTVTTPDGLVLTYGFNSGGALASVSYNTNPVTSQSYNYANTALPFALTSIVDENGNTYASWTYDSQGRALTSQLGNGANLTTISYDDTTGDRTVTNGLGQQEVYKFTTLQGVPKITEIDRPATTTTAAAIRKFTYDSNGYTASATDWNGNLTTYVNDVHGQAVTINEAVGTAQARITTITYLSNYHLPTQIATPGLTTNFTYDANGNVLTKTETDTTPTIVPYATKGTSRAWAYTWSNFLLASVKGPRTDVNQLTKFTYAGAILTETVNALGQATQVTSFTPGGWPVTIIGPNGVTTNLTYDARQRLVTTSLSTSAGPLTTSYSYDAAGNLLKTTLPDGSALANTYDVAHRLTGVADLFNQSTTYALDALGDKTQTKVLNSSAAVTHQHSAAFDALGRILHDIGGVGQTTSYAYDSNGNVLTVTDPLSHVTQKAFDALNDKIRTIDAGAGITKSTYDPHDRPLTVVDPNSGSTTYVYDGFGAVIQRISPDTGKTVYHYDLAGNLIQCIDATGAIANYTYDALDRVLTTTYPAGASENVSYTYDQTGHGFGIGRLTGVTDGVGSLSRSYDERGNILSEQRVHGVVTLLTSYAYDKASRVSAITYPSGWTVGYTRDAMGRVTAINAQPPASGAPLSVASGVTYQPFGPVSGLTYGNGIAETQSYDLDYRTTNLRDTGTSGVQNLTYRYDAADNVLSIADGVTPPNSQALGYDVMNRLTSATGRYGTLGYTYTSIGNQLTQTGGGVTTSYVYAPHSNQLTAIKTTTYVPNTFNVSGSIESEPGWPSGTISGTITIGNCVTVNLGEQCPITSINVKDSYSGITITNPGNSALYLYAAGTGAFAGQWGILPAITTGIFTLGAVFQNSPGQANSGWVYETGPCPGPPTCNGNSYAGLYYITPSGGTNGPATTQTVGNTAAGNVNGFSPAFGQVTSLTYNQSGRLATTNGSAGQITQYTYDAFGQRLVKVGTATATSLYQYDGSGRLLEETDGQGDARVDYIYLGDRPIATIQPSSNQIYFLHNDRLGTPLMATNAAQGLAWTTTYQPFGQISNPPTLIVQDLRLPGQENDLETGLYHNGFRDYVPALGRYLESDPIGLISGPNTYVYANGNPLMLTDPQGLGNLLQRLWTTLFIVGTPPTNPQELAVSAMEASGGTTNRLDIVNYMNAHNSINDLNAGVIPPPPTFEQNQIPDPNGLSMGISGFLMKLCNPNEH